MTNSSCLKMNNICIEFPGIKALDNVEFRVETGKVHALVGANGAGKSTLMKVLSGAYSHYTGEISIDNKNINIRNPKASKNHRIQIVYQEVDTALIQYLTVAENILIDDIYVNKESKFFVSWRKIYSNSQEILNSLGLNISVKKTISELTLAEKQMVLIARALAKECKFLILDEPTAPLSHRETKELFRIVNELKKSNVGIVFISHRLPELFQICDDITIMRDGKVVLEEKMDNLTQKNIVEYMLGKSFELKNLRQKRKFNNKVFEVKNLTDREERLKDINLYVNEGEIVGIAGLVGAGKTELLKGLFGELKVEGRILIDDTEIKVNSPYDAVKSGIALVPEERRKEGILVDESIRTNLTAPTLGNISNALGFLNFKNERDISVDIIEKVGIKCINENTKLGLLSGGNQQKVAIGKWLIDDHKIYLFDEPTKGVDIGSKSDIFNQIYDIANKGKAIIYASCELSEIVSITDRVYVMYDGKIVKELNTSETTEEEILFYSTGGK